MRYIQFRNSCKEDTQTFTEFAREKEIQFDCWWASKEVNLDFNKLHQLILLEEFKSYLLPHVKTYIGEHNTDSLQQAAVFWQKIIHCHTRVLFPEMSRVVMD